ncbi:MAG: hypothetical protein V7L01_16710 [Nostoc sp.]
MMNFKIQGFFTTLIIGSVSALTISDAISQKVNAQATPSCNNATITGSYGDKTIGSGTDPGTTTSIPVAGVGLVKFDGKGNFQETSAISVNGDISPNQTDSGTYSVKQDCTVQIVYRSGTSSGVIVDGGKEIFLIALVRGQVVTSTLKKVN